MEENGSFLAANSEMGVRKVKGAAMDRQIVLKQDILDVLSAAGMCLGQTVMVHCSLSALGYVCGGAQPVIEALLQTVGETGTIMMPTQSWKNLDPASGVHWQEPQGWWQLIRDNWPAYDKRVTPTNTMGAVAEMFRTWPGTLRSDHPARSVAANGPRAQLLTENHGLSNIFADGSPIARLYDLDGYVLLVGVGYDKNSAIMENGQRVWKEYRTLFVDGEDFEEIGAAFERECTVHTAALGNGTIRFMRQRELVDFAVGWIERHRAHPE